MKESMKYFVIEVNRTFYLVQDEYLFKQGLLCVDRYLHS